MSKFLIEIPEDLHHRLRVQGTEKRKLRHDIILDALEKEIKRMEMIK